MVNNTFIYSDIHTYSSVEIVCVMYSVGSVLFYYNRESWGAALQLSFGSFLEPITKIIEAHARKLLITHCAKLFWIHIVQSYSEYLPIFNECKKME